MPEMSTPLYLGAEINYMQEDRACDAKKNDGDCCGKMGKRWVIDGTKVNLCKTHLNKLDRWGYIEMYDGEIVTDSDNTNHPFNDTLENHWEKAIGRCHICGARDGEFPHDPLQIKGDVTIVPDEEISANYDVVEHNTVVNEMTESNNNKEKEEKEMDDVDSFIYHFLMEKVVDSGVIMPRIFTNRPEESEKLRYDRSTVTNRPVDSLLALNTGTWLPWFLKKRLADPGIPFRIMILSNNEVRDLSPDVVQMYHERSTFSYANDAHTFFVRVDGAAWGLEVMGLIERDVAKIAKRLAEICRLSELMYYSEEMDITMVSRAPDFDIKFYDGMNSISEAFALKMCREIPDERRRRRVMRQIRQGKMVRFNIRVLTPLGLIKGDCIINYHQKVDLVFHPENLKAELRTTGWCMATMTHHNPWHIAVWDDQTWINNRDMLPESKQRYDVDKSINDLRDSFQMGVVPEWLTLGEEMHDDSGLPDYERLSELLDRQYIRWQAHGFDIRAAQNLVYMATNGLIKRMTRELRKRPVRYYRKTWTRMTNAFLAGVMTREFMVHMTHQDIPTNNGYLQFRPEGLVMRGERFAATYDLHGGWDLDDTVKVILIKIWSSDVNKTKLLLETGALDPLCTVRVHEAEATYAALLVRSPNGPGEYSIEALDPNNWDSLPWHGLDENVVPIVDLAKAPAPQPELLKNVRVTGIPSSLTYTGEALTPDQCLAMIEAQRFNPGIGRICNCLMNWAMSFGASFPSEMLARLEQMVDTTQQLRDPVAFQAIAEEVNNLYAQMVAKVNDEDDPKFVDGLLAIAHPIPSEFAEAMSHRMVEGRFTRFNRYFDTRVQILRDEVLNNSLQMRDVLPLVQWARSINVTQETMVWAQQFNYRLNEELKMNETQWRSPDENINPFAAMHFETMRIQANKATIARAVAELRALGGDETHKKVLSLWKYILMPKKGQPYGSYDRIMFQPGDGENSIMHLLIAALLWMGQGNEFTPSES